MSGDNDLREILDSIGVEDYLDFEGFEYRITSGSSGPQCNVKTCPACGNSKWKVYLNRETGLGNCFAGSCTVGNFNKWLFAAAHLGTDNGKAIYEHLRQVARELGWRPKRRISAAVITETSVKLPPSFELPTDDGRNLLYLEQRGITGEIARYFHLRYCEDGWYNYTKPDGTPGGRNFGQRVIIPIFDLDGTLVTFQGRDVTGTVEPKYLFPPALPGSGRFLYNGHNAFRAKRVVVGEGVFDVAAIKIAIDEDVGLRDIVPIGTFGMHLSGPMLDDEGRLIGGDADGNDQIGRFLKLRKHGLEEIILMWDGEKEALKNALKAGERLNKFGFRTRVALLPKDKDPNEADARTVQQAIWKAELITPRRLIELRLRNPYG